MLGDDSYGARAFYTYEEQPQSFLSPNKKKQKTCATATADTPGPSLVLAGTLTVEAKSHMFTPFLKRSPIVAVQSWTQQTDILGFCFF